TPLSEDDYVALNARLKISGHVRYASADLAPPANSYTIELEVPSDLPLTVTADDEGYFSGEVSAFSNGFYRVNILLNQAPGIVESTPSSLRLQVDGDSPTLISFEPTFIPANTTEIILQFSLQDIGAGLSNESWTMTCQIMRGFESIGEPVQSTALQTVEGQVSRYQANLSFQPMVAGDKLDCWVDATDITGNAITGPGSTSTWPLRVPILEIRPDIIATQVVLEPANLQFGMETTVTITLENHGNQTTEAFFVTLEALEDEVGRVEARFLSGQSSTTISVLWKPDWDGELDLHIHVDAENSIDEINENNTLTLTLEIQPTPEEGFFSLNVIGGIALLLMFGMAMFALAVMFLRGSRYEGDDWEDEDEFDERDGHIVEEIAEDIIDSAL
ncbi:MAG: CARDB domain-containing protein, partial [Candidatus Thalassarchaeaceae archaeon]|nr:CARDB domain-containing protein [Candidatus Thalassarchaeaceae archaeon]